ncbi:Outer capsid protein [Trichinella spiralis]|uniref:Outer capsid protein n=1 Tax=Trichinella spiralis TaxID=6334 RepID=A0ABR3KAM6_TRISP
MNTNLAVLSRSPMLICREERVRGDYPVHSGGGDKQTLDRLPFRMKKTPSSSLDVNHPLAQKRQRRHLNVQVEVKNIGSTPQYRTLSLPAKSSKEARIDRRNVAWRFGSAENSEEHHNLSESVSSLARAC